MVPKNKIIQIYRKTTRSSKIFTNGEIIYVNVYYNHIVTFIMFIDISNKHQYFKYTAHVKICVYNISTKPIHILVGLFLFWLIFTL